MNTEFIVLIAGLSIFFLALGLGTTLAEIISELRKPRHRDSIRRLPLPHAGRRIVPFRPHSSDPGERPAA